MAAIRLTIDTDGDELRAERLVRRLREHLDRYLEFDVEFEEVVIDQAGAKGAVDALALLVVATPLVKSLAPALSSALTDFLDRNKHTKCGRRAGRPAAHDQARRPVLRRTGTAAQTDFAGRGGREPIRNRVQVTVRAPRRALLIGTSRYQHLRDLPSCAADIEAFGDVLRHREIGAYSVRTVLDRTAAEVRREIAEFLDAVRPQDLALVYFTGHGLRAIRTTGEFYFAAADTDPSRLADTGIGSGFVNDRLEECPAGQKVAILDCCLSGGFVHGFQVRDDEPPDTDRREAKGGAEGGPRGVFVLSSSGPAELSFVGTDGAGGPRLSRFTEVLVTALWTGLSGAAARGGPVSVIQLQEHVQERMRLSQPPQRPLYSALAVDSRIAIADAPQGVEAAVRSGSGAAPAPEPLAKAEAPSWPRLLAYFRDHVRAQAREPQLLNPRAVGQEFVCLTGTERMISGDLEDGEAPLPAVLADWVTSRDPRAEMWTGYPAVLLNEERAGGGARLAPLLVRRVEITDQHRLRPYGPVLPNPTLAARLLDDPDADRLIDTYEPTWLGGEHGRLAADARALLSDAFELGCVEELRPEQLAPRLDLNSPGQGARNVAVLFSVTPSEKFTAGWRKDMEAIESKAESIGRTALGLLGASPAASTRLEIEAPLLVTPQAVNDAQRQVLHSAMTRPLTVATGPPGTGKSQLVTNVIATAVAHGQRVLLASTNHGAVNEVCEKFAEFAPGCLIRTREKDNPDIERETLEGLLALQPPEPGSVATAHAELRNVWREVEKLDLELEKGVTAEVGLAGAALELRHRAAELGVDLERLRHIVGIEPSRWRRRADRAIEAAWFADWRRRRLLRQVGVEVEEPRTALSGCQALSGFAGALEVQSRARSVAEAQRPDREMVAELERATERVAHASANLVREHIRSSAHAGRRAIDALLVATATGKSDWGALQRAMPHVLAWAVTSLSARRFPPDPGMFDLVVIDEASQCSLPDIVPLLFRAKRALIIGDPMQLSTISRLDPARAARVRRQHGLAADWLDEHGLLATNSAYAAAERASAEAMLLDEHYRCHPDIANTASSLFYGGNWTVLTDSRGRPSTGAPAVVGIDVRGTPARGASGRSWINQAEADQIVDKVGELLRVLPGHATIGVVAPFAGQARLIARQVTDRFGELGESRFLSATVHKFQGRQRDVMFFSLTVRGKPARSAMAWLNKQPELWNVAITRARSNLYLVGDLELWQSRSRVVGGLLANDSIRTDSGPWDDRLLAVLTERVGGAVRIGVPRNGYRADAVVTVRGAELPVLVDGGPVNGQRGAQHRRRMLRRCALLGDGPALATRVPRWRLLEDTEIQVE